MSDKNYLKEFGIFDLDGTVFDASHRMHLIKGPKNPDGTFSYVNFKPDWDGFFKACIDDEPIWPVIDVLQALRSVGHKILFITGRSEICRAETVQSIYKYIGINLDDPKEPLKQLFMREEKDHRPDYVVKKELLLRAFPRPVDRERILGIFEDRDQVVKMYRELGLKVFQVAEGNF